MMFCKINYILLYITEDVLESDVRIWMDTEKHGFLDAGQTSGY